MLPRFKNADANITAHPKVMNKSMQNFGYDSLSSIVAPMAMPILLIFKAFVSCTCFHDDVYVSHVIKKDSER